MTVRVPFCDVVEKGRVVAGKYRSGRGDPFGAFFLKAPNGGEYLKVIAADGGGWADLGLPGPVWEHASVSCETRCPMWSEMCWVKSLFWSDDEWAVQFHPGAADYVNVHLYTLHLWRPVGVDVPRPPKECV